MKLDWVLSNGVHYGSRDGAPAVEIRQRELPSRIGPCWIWSCDVTSGLYGRGVNYSSLEETKAEAEQWVDDFTPMLVREVLRGLPE